MKIKYYETYDGKIPFKKWFDSIKNKKIKIKIIAKLEYLESEVFSTSKPVGDGVFELRPYSIRIYYLKYKNEYIILLLGGEKNKQQQRDIEKAREYARDFIRRIE
ncbi:MAG: type II toxin-antitoxin system RelE/ParE family toxin [Endomicrobium sp.]|jgi:putative addiction module killer protein|nr:type II toxin-antitoxin system RelE/ParE family toxin [Endomicrobium sp.]